MPTPEAFIVIGEYDQNFYVRASALSFIGDPWDGTREGAGAPGRVKVRDIVVDGHMFSVQDTPENMTKLLSAIGFH